MESIVLPFVTSLVFFTLSFAQTPPDEGLVASYSFQGNAADASSNGNDAEVHGATLTEGRDGKAKARIRLTEKTATL